MKGELIKVSVPQLTNSAKKRLSPKKNKKRKWNMHDCVRF
jgi:hypothetical protein